MCLLFFVNSDAIMRVRTFIRLIKHRLGQLSQLNDSMLLFVSPEEDEEAGEGGEAVSERISRGLP